MTLQLPLKFDETQIESFADVVQAVGLQGVLYLLISPTEERTDIIRDFLRKKGLSWGEADEIGCYFYALEVEIAELGALLGYALALTRPDVGRFDVWLQEAIAKAGVGMYDIAESGGDHWTNIAKMIDQENEKRRQATA